MIARDHTRGCRATGAAAQSSVLDVGGAGDGRQQCDEQTFAPRLTLGDTSRRTRSMLELSSEAERLRARRPCLAARHHLRPDHHLHAEAIGGTLR